MFTYTMTVDIPYVRINLSEILLYFRTISLLGALYIILTYLDTHNNTMTIHNRLKSIRAMKKNKRGFTREMPTERVIDSPIKAIIVDPLIIDLTTLYSHRAV